MPRPVRGNAPPRVPSARVPPQPAASGLSTPPADQFRTGADAPRSTGAAGDFATLVESMTPKLHAPSGFEAHFGQYDRRGAAVIDGLGSVPLPQADRMRPGFTAEAGKPFTVTIDPARIMKSAEKVELVWRMAPTGDEHVLPMSDGTRSPDGALVLSPARFDVPPEVMGTMRLSIRTTDAQGRVSTSWDPTYDALVAPKAAGSTLVFSDDWKAQLDTPLRAGEKLQLAYDADRTSALFSGNAAQRVSAFLRINGGPAQEYPLSLEDGSLVMPTIPLPLDATDVDLWFKGERDGEANYDSAFGKNYHFDVGPTRDDADPSWKSMVLKSPSFPNLKADNFVAIGPYSQSYNCIAWTVGVRDEWVWPGDSIKAFDDLYAKSGYRPLDDMNTALDPTLEKVVIFGLEKPDGSIEVTHGVKQEADGRWTSKLGTEPLIRHDQLDGVAGPAYGQPVRVYVRPRQEVPS